MSCCINKLEYSSRWIFINARSFILHATLICNTYPYFLAMYHFSLEREKKNTILKRKKNRKRLPLINEIEQNMRFHKRSVFTETFIYIFIYFDEVRKHCLILRFLNKSILVSRPKNILKILNNITKEIRDIFNYRSIYFYIYSKSIRTWVKIFE